MAVCFLSQIESIEFHYPDELSSLQYSGDAEVFNFLRQRYRNTLSRDPCFDEVSTRKVE